MIGNVYASSWPDSCCCCAQERKGGGKEILIKVKIYFDWDEWKRGGILCE